jgi:hypothetical protein
MINAIKAIALLSLCCSEAGMAQAQPPKPTAQSEAGEPRADTSHAPAPEAATTAPPATATPRTTPPARATTAVSPAPPAVSSARAAGNARPAFGQPQRMSSTTDRLDLGTATVTGSQEQPKVMYIVPWKRSDIGDLAGKPMNSLVDEILAPVDRDVFKREVVYYQAVQSQASQNGAQGTPSPQGEK